METRISDDTTHPTTDNRNSANFVIKAFYEVQDLACNASSWSSTKPYILWCWTKMQDLGSSRIHRWLAMMVAAT